MANMFASVVYLDGDMETEDELTRPGKVKVEFENGDTFEGTYIKNKEGNGLIRSGPGVYIWKSGGKYEGNYENGRRNGNGTYSFPNGEKYEGGWENNVKSGPGKYSYANGDVFTGTWVGDKRNGKGSFYNAREDVDIKGEWKDGKLIMSSVSKAKPAKKEPEPVVEKKEPEPVVETKEPVAKAPVEEVQEEPKELTPVVPETPEEEDTIQPVEDAPAEDAKPPEPELETTIQPVEDIPAGSTEGDKDVEILDKQEAAAEDATEDVPAVVPPPAEEAPAAEENKPMVIIIAGAPASGKGTQCKQIVEKFGVVHISTGDLLRQAVKDQTELGKQAKGFMDRGELVDKEIVNAILKERLEQEDCKTKGILLDGYPRTKEQAEDLASLGIDVNLVVLLDVPEAELIKRACGRRLDPKTNTIYHVETNPPPEGVEVIHRSDDHEEAVRHRLKLFAEKIEAIEEYYSGLIEKIDGARHPEEVTKDVVSLVEKVEQTVTEEN